MDVLEKKTGIFIALFIGLRTANSYNRRLLSFTRESEMQFKLLVPALLLVAGVLASNNVFAEADAKIGATKAYTCTGCHGIPGYNNIYPTYKVPKLGGQNFEYLVAALHAYRDGERKHSTMELQASSLSDQDILDISAYFVEVTKEK
jgi:cytochrome c553